MSLPIITCKKKSPTCLYFCRVKSALVYTLIGDKSSGLSRPHERGVKKNTSNYTHNTNEWALHDGVGRMCCTTQAGEKRQDLLTGDR
jgi:hypothetical protein